MLRTVLNVSWQDRVPNETVYGDLTKDRQTERLADYLALQSTVTATLTFPQAFCCSGSHLTAPVVQDGPQQRLWTH